MVKCIFSTSITAITGKHLLALLQFVVNMVCFAKMGDQILKQTGRDSEDYRNFSSWLLFYSQALESEQQIPDPALVADKRLLRSLDGLAHRYLEKGLLEIKTDLLGVKTSQDEADHSEELITNLQQQIANDEVQLRVLEMRRKNQEKYGQASENLLREIADLQTRLETNRSKLGKPLFRVSRVVNPDDVRPRVERPINVEVKIENLGRQLAEVHYQEGIAGPSVQLFSGGQIYKGSIEPGETVSLCYSFYCLKPGTVRLYTDRLGHQDQMMMGWHDIAPECELQVVSGTP